MGNVQSVDPLTPNTLTMGVVQSGDGWCSCSKSQRSFQDEQDSEPSPPSLCPADAEPREDPAELLRGLRAGEVKESARVGDRAPTPPRNPRLSRQAPPQPTAPPSKSKPATLGDDLADIFPQARARAARRHLSSGASQSCGAQSLQSALKVWTCAAG